MLEDLGVVAVVLSVVFLAWQTRGAAQASEAVMQSELSALLQGAMLPLVERPTLRPYLYDGKPLPEEGTPEREQVLVVAELLVDCIEACLENAHTLPRYGQRNGDDLEGWALRVLDDSPAVLHLVERYGANDWPRVHALRVLTPAGVKARRAQGPFLTPWQRALKKLRRTSPRG